MNRRLVALTGLAAIALTGIAMSTVALLKVERVGEQSERGILVNTGEWIKPDGQLTVFGARPVDVVLSPDGRLAYIKENDGLTVVDSVQGEILQRLNIPGGSSQTGLAINADGTRVYYSTSRSDIYEIDTSTIFAKIARKFTMPKPKVGGDTYPCGLTIHNGKLYAALSRSNQVGEISLETGEMLRAFDVSPSPFAVSVRDNELWVTCWGTTPKDGQKASPSSETPVAIDSRGIATGGQLAVIDLQNGKVMKSLDAGSQPCELAIRDKDVLVASADSDQIFSFNRKSGERELIWKSSVSSAPSSVTTLDDGTIAVACGGSNEIVLLDPKTNKPKETYRSAWYPTAVRGFKNNLFVVSAKGLGEREGELHQGKFDSIAKTERYDKPISAEAANKKNVFQFTGSLSIIPRSAANAREPNKLPTELAARSGMSPVPIPARVGEPSVFKHVIYVLKENRTYDQLFGDINSGDGDPSLCIFGEKVTPNHHALATEFALLDNYYCNGVLSADGHSWSTEGNATTYFERSFGGWTRSYPFGGDDPLAISSTGHIWDAVLDKGLSFRNYGEYDNADLAKGDSYLKILSAFESGKEIPKFKHNILMDRLREHSDPDCPGWNLQIPDVLRASYFLRDIKAANEGQGELAQFNFVYLPQDHTSGAGAGSPAPNAQVADNDLALGRIADAVSHSKFWQDTVILVIEDDPQAGFDHVDGHRSICLVISPYTRRKSVVSTFYNQTAVLKSMSHILGVKPTTRYEMEANLLSDCFQNTPDLTPYTVKPNQIPLDQMNPVKSAFRQLDVSKPDLGSDDEFNRQLWWTAKGSTPYPTALAGAHGRGLKAKGLKVETIEGKDADDDDDDDD